MIQSLDFTCMVQPAAWSLWNVTNNNDVVAVRQMMATVGTSRDFRNYSRDEQLHMCSMADASVDYFSACVICRRAFVICTQKNHSIIAYLAMSPYALRPVTTYEWNSVRNWSARIGPFIIRMHKGIEPVRRLRTHINIRIAQCVLTYSQHFWITFPPHLEVHTTTTAVQRPNWWQINYSHNISHCIHIVYTVAQGQVSLTAFQQTQLGALALPPSCCSVNFCMITLRRCETMSEQWLRFQRLFTWSVQRRYCGNIFMALTDRNWNLSAVSDAHVISIN